MVVAATKIVIFHGVAGGGFAVMVVRLVAVRNRSRTCAVIAFADVAMSDRRNRRKRRRRRRSSARARTC